MRNVLVVGASVAGLTTAYWLAQYGFQVSIVEIETELCDLGQVFNIKGVPIDVIARMGIAKRVEEKQEEFQGFSIVNDRAEKLNQTKLQSKNEKLNYTLLRYGFIKILADITLSSSLVSIFMVLLSNVFHHLHPKSQYNSHQEKQNLIMQLLEPIRVYANYYFFNAIEYLPIRDERCCFWSIPKLLDIPSGWQITYNLDTNIVVNLFSIKNHDRILISVNFLTSDQDSRNQKKWKYYTKDLLERYLTWFNMELLAKSLEDCTDFYSIALKQIRLPKWHQDRIVLVGGAGYCTSPSLALGTSNALIRSYLLAGRIYSSNSKDPIQSFTACEQELRPVIESAQSLTSDLKKIVQKLKIQNKLQYEEYY